MSATIDEVPNNEVRVDLQKREFMSKFGKYAVVSAGMATLMTPTVSTAGNYGCETKTRSKHRSRHQARSRSWFSSWFH